MKALAMALLGALIAVGSTGCCCSHLGGCGGGCGPCGSYGGYGVQNYSYAPACNSCGPSYGGGCPSGNCGVGAPGYFPSGANYGPTDMMQAYNGGSYSTPVAMAPQTFAQGPGMYQTAMAPLESLPTY